MHNLYNDKKAGGGQIKTNSSKLEEITEDSTISPLITEVNDFENEKSANLLICAKGEYDNDILNNFKVSLNFPYIAENLNSVDKEVEKVLSYAFFTLKFIELFLKMGK